MAGQRARLTTPIGTVVAQARWWAVNAPHLVPLMRAGASFQKGKLIERQADHDTDVKVA